MEYRTETIKARVTPTELKVIEKKLEESGYTMSAFIRKSVLGNDVIIIDDLKEFVKELKGIGRNLNQLTILSNQGKINSPNLYEARDKLDETWKLLNIILTKTKKTR